MQQEAEWGDRRVKTTGGRKRKEKGIGKSALEHVSLSSDLLHYISRKQ